MKQVSLLLTGFVLFNVLLVSTACFKKDRDLPPDQSNYDPNLPVNTTIAELRAMPKGTELKEDIIISGIVVMDDRGGNYFKTIVIQDSSGGIEIEADQNNLFNDYPVGRKIYVKCSGLFLDKTDENPHLGYTPDANGNVSPIPFILLDRFIVKATYPEQVIPDTLPIATLINPLAAKQYLNTLIVIKNAEFTDSSAGIPYAEPASVSSTTLRYIEDCTGISIALSTSGYARFQSYLSPLGKGSITALYTRYNGVSQLRIRDTTDIRFNGTRCNSISGTLITIDSLRKLHIAGSAITLHGLTIRGIVISDAAHGNISTSDVILQGSAADKGIVLYYAGEHNYDLGDSLELNLNGCVLKSFNDKLEITGISSSKTTLLDSNRYILPKNTTIAEIVADRTRFESTLVTLHNISWVNDPATYNGSSGNLTISDGTGNLKHFCSTMATFKDDPLPPDPVNSMTGYIDIFNGTVQIRIRNPDAPTQDIIP